MLCEDSQEGGAELGHLILSAVLLPLLYTSLHSFSRAAITNYHKAGSLKKNRKLFSQSPGSQKFKIKVLAGCVPSGGSGENPFHTCLPSFYWLLAILAHWLVDVSYSLCLCLHMSLP
jgi:hypothetical protein